MVESVDANNLTVLVVEDHDVARMGLIVMLKNFPGVEVISEARDGGEALEKAIEFRPRVVLMDIGLPKIDGVRATELIKQHCKDTKVIMVTSHDSDDDIFAALAAGADGYCLKNISKQLLGLAIHSVSEGAAWLHPTIAVRVLRSIGKDEFKVVLTERQLDILRCIAQGLTNIQVSDQLGITVETVKSHLRLIMNKLAVSSRDQAVEMAKRHGLI